MNVNSTQQDEDPGVNVPGAVYREDFKQHCDKLLKSEVKDDKMDVNNFPPNDCIVTVNRIYSTPCNSECNNLIKQEDNPETGISIPGIVYDAACKEESINYVIENVKIENIDRISSSEISNSVSEPMFVNKVSFGTHEDTNDDIDFAFNIVPIVGNYFKIRNEDNTLDPNDNDRNTIQSSALQEILLQNCHPSELQRLVPPNSVNALSGVHLPLQYPCTNSGCDKIYAHKTSLQKHSSVCLQRHKGVMHTCVGVKPVSLLKCDIRPKTLRNSLGLQRHKQQNKHAATRYRQKKKAEANGVGDECGELEARNNELHASVDTMTKEIQFLKDLLVEFYEAKGMKLTFPKKIASE